MTSIMLRIHNKPTCWVGSLEATYPATGFITPLSDRQQGKSLGMGDRV